MNRRRQKRLAWAAVALGVTAAFWQCLPEPLFDTPSSTILFGRDGALLGARLASDGQWRFPPGAAVPDKFRQAIIQFEDKRFEMHPGVDPLALGRAIYQNLAAGHVVSGASTLSMQVIRLARHNPGRTLTEKLIELVMAVRLELGHSKRDILAMFADNAPFGGNVVGLDAAAWRYFGRSPANLSWAESATLAVLPNSPALIHPGKNRALLKAKRDRLLHGLHDAGRLSDLDLQLALAEPLPEAPLPLPSRAPQFLETMHAANPSMHRIESTLDATLQDRLTELVTGYSSEMSRQDIYNAAAIVIDNNTFEVLAYVGNSGKAYATDHGRAVDLIRSPRSTGSILKPFLFATLIQEGMILPNTLVPDIPTQYAGYIPENYDRTYRGAVTASEALARSLNVPAVRMLRRYGVDHFYDFLHDMGFSTLVRSPDDYGLSLILGGAEGTLWDIAGMYANLASIASHHRRYRQDIYSRPVCLKDRKPVTTQLSGIGAGAAWLTEEALLEVRRPDIDGQWRNFSSSRKIAWKTGTSYGLRDAWAVGSTTRYTVGVWVGNASGEGRPGLTGTTAAAPLLFSIFDKLERSNWFEPPYEQMKQVDACTDDGFLSNGRCKSAPQWVPAESHFSRITPYHFEIHLDKKGWRVHGRCESVSNMIHTNWFVLPAAQEYYYRRQHSDFRPLPRYRPDCARIPATGPDSPISILYPTPGTRVYIPVDLDGKKSRVVFEAVHRNADAVLYWHIDDTYLGTTETYHQQSVELSAGRHVLTIVDSEGNRVSERFTVLEKQAPLALSDH
ncbi:MAG TPA: penicillin-binding protein 1C [Mariprofundaceae bacterium]|nr:penicillin-binding protein 1C [Mariprofundaceae bacterium]